MTAFPRRMMCSMCHQACDNYSKEMQKADPARRVCLTCQGSQGGRQASPSSNVNSRQQGTVCQGSSPVGDPSSTDQLNLPNLYVVDDDKERQKQIRQLVVDVCPRIFADCRTNAALKDQIKISVLSGGVTNQLYRVVHPTKGGSVVVRVFGKETERIISRDAELFWQSQFLHTFAKGKNTLVYEFLDGYKDCTPEEMPVYALPIAVAMAKFHIQATTAAIAVMPYATEDNFTDVALTHWIDFASDPNTRDKIPPKQLQLYDQLDLNGQFRKEAQWLHGVIEHYKPNLPVGVCHNDLLSANIMLKRDPVSGKGLVDLADGMKLIDFEYCKRNYLYYDIGNHFNEYGGLDGNWAAYPKDKEAKAFIAEYLLALRSLSLQNFKGPIGNAEVEEVLTYVKVFSMAAHLCWSAWGILQGAFSVIDFDFVEYAHLRWNGYLTVKEQVKGLLPK